MTVAPTLGFRPLVGLATQQNAMRMGYNIEKNTELLRRYIFLERQLQRIMVAHLNGVPEWEIKQAFGLHQWQDAEHCLWLCERVRNMRNPAPHLAAVPDVKLQAFTEELIRSRGSLELMVGLYQVAKPAMRAAYEHHLKVTNPIADYPTVRMLRFAIQEIQEQIEWGQSAIDVLIKSDTDLDNVQSWSDHLSGYLKAAGGVSGDREIPTTELPPARAVEPFAPQRKPLRDSRFDQVMHFRGYGPAANADAHEMNAWTMYKLMTEMNAPDMLSLFLYDMQDQSWEFYRDVGRHLWDECRHSMIGQVAFERRGLDWTKVVHDIGFGLFTSTRMDPVDRYLVLVGTEQGLMAKTGKARQYSYAVDSHDEFFRQCNDYDWADEVLHVQIGMKWLKQLKPNIDLKYDSQVLTEKYLQLVKDNMHMASDPHWWDRWYADVRQKDGLVPKDQAQHENTKSQIDTNTMVSG